MQLHLAVLEKQLIQPHSLDTSSRLINLHRGLLEGEHLLLFSLVLDHNL